MISAEQYEEERKARRADYIRKLTTEVEQLVKGEAPDPYGKAIKIGSVVAYNYQGQVRIGTVSALSQRLRYGLPNGFIEITMIPSKLDTRFGDHVRKSKVTRNTNLVVLEY